jgi:hypothetical protein
MARGITKEESLPGYAQSTAPRIKVFGFNWMFFPEWKLADPNHRVQIRPIAQLAPAREIAKYAQDLKRGDQMPPVIMTSDYYVIDGNTRTEAARKIGRTTFPTFVLDVNYSDATDSQRKQLIALGASMNLTHGRSMNIAATAAIIESITYDDTSPKQLAKDLHIPESTANTYLNAAKTRRRAKRVGVELKDTLTNSHLKLFGNKTKYFSDQVFKVFIQLTQDARLTVPATTILSRRLEDLGTEDERLDLLKVEREAYSDVIEGGQGNPSKAAKLRQSLGFLINADAEVLAEHNPQASRLHTRTIRQAYEQLEKIMDAQIRVERARKIQTGE